MGNGKEGGMGGKGEWEERVIGRGNGRKGGIGGEMGNRREGEWI